MTKTETPVLLEIDGQRVVETLQEASEMLDDVGSEATLDFTSVRRIEPSAIKALEELARKADDKAVRVVLRGVNVDVYKVLKLAKLAPRFSFVA